MRYVMSANHRHAKFAARLLVFTKNHDEVCPDVVEVRSTLLYIIFA